MARIGIEWVNKYHGNASDLTNCQTSAERFYNKLSGTRAFNWGDDWAWDQDFEEQGVGTPPAGTDTVWVDNVSIAYFAGHGGRTGPTFGVTGYDNRRVHHTEARWGNGDLEWIVFDACQVLRHDPFSAQFLAQPIQAAICGDGQFSGKAYFFAGDYYIRYNWNDDKVDDLYPKRTRYHWHNWPSSFNNGIDAALCGHGPFSGKGYFFKGNQYIRYDWSNDSVDFGYPKSIASHWPGWPGSFNGGVDAAINGQGPFGGKAYFFKGNQYIRYDWSNDSVDAGYPKSIAGNWPGLTGNFGSGYDAALSGDGPFSGKGYFFKGNQYVRYDWSNDSVDSGYPKNISANWHNWPRANGSAFDRWRNSFAGLHTIFGFYTNCSDESKRGGYFADYLNDGYTVIEAWKKASKETEDSDCKWAYMRSMGGNGVNTYNDHWHGNGWVSPDPTNTSRIYSLGSC